MSVSRCHRLKKTLFCESFKWSSFAKTLILHRFCKMLHNFVVGFRATRNGVCALHSDTCSSLHLAQVIKGWSLSWIIVENHQVAAANCPEDLESLGQGFHQLHSLNKSYVQLSTPLNRFQQTILLFVTFSCKSLTHFHEPLKVASLTGGECQRRWGRRFFSFHSSTCQLSFHWYQTFTSRTMTKVSLPRKNFKCYPLLLRARHMPCWGHWRTLDEWSHCRV